MPHRPDSAHSPGEPHWLQVLAEVLAEYASSAQAERLRVAAAGMQRARRVGLQPLHRWWAEGLLPMLADTLKPQRPALARLQQLHGRAALGVSGSLGEWRAALAPVLQPVYRRAYAYDAAYAQAYGSALAYAEAQVDQAPQEGDFSDPESFARYYAQLSTDAAACAFAQAHASAALELAARAYATDDEATYASLAGPLARVCAWACSPEQHARSTVYARMAEQLLASLVPTASSRTASRDADATFPFKR